MTQSHMSFLSICILAILCSATGFARAADPACKPVFDAMTKAAATPNHMFMTTTAATNARPESSETITTANMMYLKVDGAWRMEAYNAQQQVTEMQKAASTTSIACQHLHDDTVAGESVEIYNTQQQQAGGSMINSQLWISKARGLPVKQTMDIDIGGKFGKSHTDMRYDYNNVQAPAGTK